MAKLRKTLSTAELSVLFFLLLLLLFSWPLVRIADMAGQKAALYLFALWALSALGLLALTRRLRRSSNEEDPFRG